MADVARNTTGLFARVADVGMPFVTLQIVDVLHPGRANVPKVRGNLWRWAAGLSRGLGPFQQTCCGACSPSKPRTDVSPCVVALCLCHRAS
eukprot:scaffold6758_cov350-Prasinococcus_capsulatus_cf.AAC.2